jgi:hypothetical protein
MYGLVLGLMLTVATATTPINAPPTTNSEVFGPPSYEEWVKNPGINYIEEAKILYPEEFNQPQTYSFGYECLLRQGIIGTPEAALMHGAPPGMKYDPKLFTSTDK